MTKHAAVRFERLLRRLFTHWSAGLVSLVRARRGPLPNLHSQKLRRAIEKLQDEAEKCRFRTLVINGMRDRYERRVSWRVRTNGGRGPLARRTAFMEWYENHVGARNCVYVFWAGRRCRYVGRTTVGRSRPKTHFEKHWAAGVTRVDVYECRGRRDLAALECLAMHRFQPSHNRARSAQQRYLGKCRVCALRRRVRLEARRIFRLR
ncbi:MAG: hypothetical protein IT457_04125 [Planctomycetes bacterium]|nr:hypothetical protein [Planctomycetota bacterium]